MSNPYLNGFKKGDKLKCITARDLTQLTVGQIYEAAKDEEEGIFADRPYITVTDGKKHYSCHSSRFEKVEAA